MNGGPRERAPGDEDPASPTVPERAPYQPQPEAEDQPHEAPHWQEVADAVWLAAYWTRTGRPAPGATAPAEDDRPEEDGAPAFPARPPDVRHETTGDEPRAFAELTLPAPDPEGPRQFHLGPPVLPRARPHVPGQAARATRLARALHRLGRRVPSFDTPLLDEELTAERMAADELWMPWFRPGEVKAFDLVVLIDSGPTMGIWREETAALRAAAEHSGAFRSVLTTQVHLPRAGAAAPTLRWSATRSTADLGEVLNGRRDRLFLVVTDGLGHGWAAPAADHLLQRLGGAGPTALVHLLPPHLRHRSSLYPHAVVLEAAGFGAANHGLSLAPPPAGPDPMRPLPEEDGAMAVPVLSLKSGSLTAWSELVVGGRGVRRQLPAVLAGSLRAGRPAPGLRAPQRPSAAAAAVRRFFTLATPAARRLATHLAAAPFEFDLVQQLRSRTMPHTGAEHLAEILMGGLIDWDDTGTRPPDFADGVREALLATTTRRQLATVISILGELPAAGAHGVALRAALRDPAGVALPDPSARAWRQSELAVMRALGGPYSDRARRIAAAGISVTSHAESVTGEAVDGPAPLGDPRTGAIREPSDAIGDTAETAETAVSSESEPQGSPAVMVNVPARNNRFVSRSAHLRTLTAMLAEQDTVCLLPDVRHRSGAVGTSELALEYVYRHAHDYDLICWIPAERRSLLLATLASLAGPLGLGHDTNPLPVGPAALAVLRALRSGTPYDRWLLVFDNAEDVEAVRRHLPTGGPGKVVVTSRNRAWGSAAAPMEVSVFEREESVALLRKLSPALPAGDADRLAHVLDDLPLAVEQVGAWHAVTGMATDEYLQLLDRRRPTVGTPEVTAACPVLLAAAWDISLDRLQERSPDARRLLELCASMGSEPIPRPILRAGRAADGKQGSVPLPGDPVELARAVRALSELSLVRIDHRADTLRLHRLLRTVLSTGLAPEQRERIRATAHHVLAAARPGNHTSPQEWPAYWSLLPHLLTSQAVTSTDRRVRALVHETVLFLDHRGDHEGAVSLGQQARAVWLAASGEENREVLRITKTYGSLLRRTGRIAESVPLTGQALEVSRRGAADPEEIVDSLCELADARRHQGRFREARDLSREATELARSRFGSDDATALRATHSWGADLRLCGQFEEALGLDQENARLREQLFGPVDALTLDSLNAVSLDMRESGDYAGARDLQEDLHRRAQSALGEMHPLTLRIAGTLAVCRRRDGALRDAAVLSEATLRHFTARYGPDHPEALSAAIDAAVDKRLAGDLGASRDLAARTVRSLGARLGEDHPGTLGAQANLATTMRALGCLDEAQELEDDVARGLDRAVGPHHMTSLTVAIGRANTAFARLDFDQARHRDEATVCLLAETAGTRHPLRLACTANLALDLRGLGRGAEADELQRTAVEGLAAVVQADHPWLLAARQRRRIECDIASTPL